MGRLGELDTNTEALTNRINAHAAFGKRDLEEWVFAQLDVRPGHSILELGCGTGKQTIPLARLVGNHGGIKAVDLADDSISILRQKAETDGLIARIDLVNSSLDDTETYLHEADTFDRAVACYSVYYANEPAKLFAAVHSKLNMDGRFFFCGPARMNNSELKALHQRVSDKRLPITATSFMEDEGLKLAKECFSRVIVTSFINPLSFSSADALYDYWRSHNLYDPGSDSRFKDAANSHFIDHDVFVTNKRVCGALAIK